MDFLCHVATMTKNSLVGGAGYIVTSSNIIVQYVIPFNFSDNIIVQNTLYMFANFNYNQLLVCKSMKVCVFVQNHHLLLSVS